MKINASEYLDSDEIYRKQKSSFARRINNFLISKGFKRVFASDIYKQVSSLTLEAYGESYAATLEDYPDASVAKNLAKDISTIASSHYHTLSERIISNNKFEREYVFELNHEHILGKSLELENKHLYFTFNIISNSSAEYIVLNTIAVTWRIDLVED